MDYNKDEYLELLKELIQIESPYFHEDKIMDFVCLWLNVRGVNARIHEYYDEKITGHKGKNVVGVIDSGKEGPNIFLGGHLDTVMLCENWEKEPFSGLIIDDKMYGVGAIDMKAGDAAVMMALVKAQEENLKGKLKGKIFFQFASVEEGPFGLGTMFYINDNVDDIQGNVDFAIITEPSSGFTGVEHPCVCLGARGGYNYTIKVSGKSAHAAIPELGVNAVVDGSRIVSELEKIPSPIDDKLGNSAPCIIRMDGGGAACSVPDYCEIEIFHHTVRGESEETIKKRVDDAVSRANVRSKVEVCFRKSPCDDFGGGFDAYCVEEDNPYVLKLNDAIYKNLGKKANIAYFQSIGDFNHFGGKLKVPTVLFGPDGENFHGANENVDINSAWDIATSLNQFVIDTMCE